jgi:hypothetical protein
MTTASASKDHALKSSSMADPDQSSQVMLTHQEDGPVRQIASACWVAPGPDGGGLIAVIAPRGGGTA